MNTNHNQLTNAVVKLEGKDSNALSAIGAVRLAIRRSNHPELEESFTREAMEGDYDHMLQTCMRYVSVE